MYNVVPSRSPRRIAIFRALYLGDLLLSIPAIRAIRAQFPRAEITLIGLPWAASCVQHYSRYIDRFVEFAGYPGIQEVPVLPERSKQFLEEQRAYGYDLVIQMHGSGLISNAFILSLGARVTAGYYVYKRPSELTIGAPYPDDQHEIYRNLQLAALVGCRDLEPQLEFPLSAEDHAEAVAMVQRVLPGRAIIGIHPGARPPARRWPAEYFATLADELAYRYKASIVLTGGPGEEELVQAVEERMQTPVLNLAGATSLGSLAALISGLDLFISNDTGPAHIACAVDTPSIALFGPADAVRWSPLDRMRHVTVRHPVECSPCGYWECPIDHRCLRWIVPKQVLLVAQRLLGVSVG